MPTPIVEAAAEAATTLPAHYLPQFVVEIGALLAIVLTIFKIAEHIQRWRTKPNLEVRLTGEVFFRLTDQGEAVFSNAVLMARSGAIEVRSVDFILEKCGQVTKTYPVKPLYYGEKKPGNGNFADNNFYSQSQIMFITEHIPQRIVFFNVISGYAEEIKQEMISFSSQAISLKAEGNARFATAFSDEAKSALYLDTLNSLSNIERDVHQKISNLIQIEGGDYILKIKVGYRDSSNVTAAEQSKESSISFKIEDNIKALYANALTDFLRNRAINMIPPRFCRHPVKLHWRSVRNRRGFYIPASNATVSDYRTLRYIRISPVLLPSSFQSPVGTPTPF